MSFVKYLLYLVPSTVSIGGTTSVDGPSISTSLSPSAPPSPSSDRELPSFLLALTFSAHDLTRLTSLSSSSDNDNNDNNDNDSFSLSVFSLIAWRYWQAQAISESCRRTRRASRQSIDWSRFAWRLDSLTRLIRRSIKAFFVAKYEVQDEG
ncbi:hypothetical protein C8R45DRAFT_1088490 [Mycena sanguinolenta]|nr:hypothetical protein C8R45DRAFT_1088490 [Mycena sanguinolenta]